MEKKKPNSGYGVEIAHAPDPPLLGKLSSSSADFCFSSSPTAFFARHRDATARVRAAASETSLCLSAFPAAPRRNPGPAGGRTLRRFWITPGPRLPPARLAPAAHCPKKKKGRGKKRRSTTLKVGESCDPVSPVEIIITEGYLVEHFCKW